VDNEAVLSRAVETFNDPGRREEYFELYDPEVVLHGYPPGCEGLEGARAFYRGLWRERPDDALVLHEVVADGDCLSVAFSYGSDRGETRLRFRDGRVVERWQGTR
jgi:hypothetical protein